MGLKRAASGNWCRASVRRLALFAVTEDVERDEKRDRNGSDTAEEHDRLIALNIEREREQEDAKQEEREGDDEVDDVHEFLHWWASALRPFSTRNRSGASRLEFGEPTLQIRSLDVG